MAGLDIVMVFVLTFLWGVLLVLRAFKLPSLRVSAFELRRRVEAHDSLAEREQNRQNLGSTIDGTKNILIIVVLVTFISLSLVLSGWWAGILISLIALLALQVLAVYPKLTKFVNARFEAKEEPLLRRIAPYRWLARFSSPRSHTEQTIASKEELADLIERSQGAMSQADKKYLKSALGFETVKVADVMTPKSMIESIDISDGTGPLVMDSLHKTGHSRFPVIKDDIDHVVGMLYLHDLITLTTSHKSVKDAMRIEVYYIRQDQNLKHALHAFLRTHHHLFIVVNTFRETVGLLSLEDVIESMLGSEVIDEFDEFHDLRKVAETNPRSNNEPKGKTDI